MSDALSSRVSPLLLELATLKERHKRQVEIVERTNARLEEIKPMLATASIEELLELGAECKSLTALVLELVSEISSDNARIAALELQMKRAGFPQL